MGSRKGFVSFILFFAASLILILALSPQPSRSSLAPAYASKITYDTHVGLKRTLAPSAKESLKTAQDKINEVEAAADTIAIANPPLSLQIKNFISQNRKRIITSFVLSGFEQAAEKYSASSGLQNFLHCKTPGIPQPWFSNISAPPDEQRWLEQPSLWANCFPWVSVNTGINSTVVSIKEGFYLKTSNPLGIEMDSKIEPFEVEG
ncbi:MAG: hypothetical protein V1822_04260 [Candidatus Micrarchaeota archaeon]